jgi:hypothetical protein
MGVSTLSYTRESRRQGRRFSGTGARRKIFGPSLSRGYLLFIGRVCHLGFLALGLSIILAYPLHQPLGKFGGRWVIALGYTPIFVVSFPAHLAGVNKPNLDIDYYPVRLTLAGFDRYIVFTPLPGAGAAAPARPVRLLPIRAAFLAGTRCRLYRSPNDSIGY